MSDWDWVSELDVWKLNVLLDQLEVEAGWWHTELVEGSAGILGRLSG